MIGLNGDTEGRSDIDTMRSLVESLLENPAAGVSCEQEGALGTMLYIFNYLHSQLTLPKDLKICDLRVTIPHDDKTIGIVSLDGPADGLIPIQSAQAAQHQHLVNEAIIFFGLERVCIIPDLHGNEAQYTTYYRATRFNRKDKMTHRWIAGERYGF